MLKVPKRLSPKESEIIDRTQTITFTFEGKEYTAHPGDTIASALAANGVGVISRSFKYHRPRGLLCCAGHCPNCLVQVGDVPNVRACIQPLEDGMIVEPQNVRPSLAHDAMSLTRFGDRFLPVGFYYKTFIHPRQLWPVYETFLRNAAGLGKVNIASTIPDGYDKQYLHTDVAIIGGGTSGLQAAIAAAETGARTILFDENGAKIRDWRLEIANLQSPISNPQIFTNTTVLGWWEDNWLAAVSGQRLYKIRAKAVVVATGAIEQPLIFGNNDLPGVMLGSGVQRLLNLYGVKPGETAVIITANDQGWQVAADLQAAGITVAAVADERLAFESEWVEKVRGGGTAVHWGHTILTADGSGRVERAIIAPVDEHGEVSTGAKRTIECDLIVTSVGWSPANGPLYQAGAKIVYDHERAMFMPQELPPGIYAAGRVKGTFDEETAVQEGRLAGQQAAMFADYSVVEFVDVKRFTKSRYSSTLIKTSGKGSAKGKKFVCFCEDVTDKDVETAIAEGFDSLELLKRYSTISMGPCQGKMCSLNAIHLCARANGWTIEETGTTTARPPLTPVEMGALAGQMLEPVQVTAVHDWHIAHGAKMMVAGLWLRPEHYGDPLAEVTAVRQRVGLIDVSTLGKLKLTGPGVPALLDKIYINKWQKLETGHVRYGLMCNDEGVVLDDGVTARVGEQEWYTTVTSSGASAMYEWIQWWLQSGWGEGVHVTNVTEGWVAFNLAGPQSRAVLQRLSDADVSNQAFHYMHVRELELAGVLCRVLRLGFMGELSYEIHAPAGYGLYLWQAIMAAGEAFNMTPFGLEAQRILRLEKAHIIVGQDTDALSDPISADMEWAVKLDKADFLGQRALTRISQAGPKQKLVGFKMVDKAVVPEEGLQIVRPNPHTPIGLEIIGWITSSRYSPTLDEAIGLCWLPVEIATQPGATFTIRREGKLVQARVHHGPFYDPKGERLKW
jgi:sarcosine oxidase subunit alpha